MEQFSLESLLLYKDEIVFLMLFSMLGVFIHEHSTKRRRLIPFLLTFDNYIVSFVVTVICFGIDPYLSQLSDRITIVVPIIMGMVGKEILNRLLTLQGSTSLIEYILGFAGITNDSEKSTLGIPTEEDIANAHKKASEPEESEENKKSVQVTAQVNSNPNPVAQQPIAQENANAALEPPSAVTSISQYEGYMDLDNMVHSSLDSICNLVVDYYAHKDVESFLRGYHTLNVTMEILNHKLAQKQTVPVPTVLKMFEIGKKQTEIDLIYNQIINDIRKEKE